MNAVTHCEHSCANVLRPRLHSACVVAAPTSGLSRSETTRSREWPSNGKGCGKFGGAGVSVGSGVGIGIVFGPRLGLGKRGGVMESGYYKAKGIEVRACAWIEGEGWGGGRRGRVRGWWCACVCVVLVWGEMGIRWDWIKCKSTDAEGKIST